MFPFKFKLSGNNSGLFLTITSGLCYVHVFLLLWVSAALLLT